VLTENNWLWLPNSNSLNKAVTIVFRRYLYMYVKCIVNNLKWGATHAAQNYLTYDKNFIGLN